MESQLETGGKQRTLNELAKSCPRSEPKAIAFEKQRIIPRIAEFEQARVRNKGVSPPADLETALDLVSDGPKPDLAVLTDLQAILHPDKSGLRNTAITPLWIHHQPLSPEVVARSLDRFFGWATSPGFLQMHPVEQMALAQIRLLEIHPFESCVPSAFLFSYAFLTHNGFLLPTFGEKCGDEYEGALTEAFQFSTGQMISLNLDACIRSYDFLEGLEILD